MRSDSRNDPEKGAMQRISTRFYPFSLCAVLAMALCGCGGGGKSASATPPATSAIAASPANDTLTTRVDEVVNNFMRTNGATAVTASVVRDGVVLYEKGHGYLDAARTQALPPDALLVTASIVKPVTAAAIQHLAAAGKLALSDHAFCTGDNAPCWLPKNLTSATTDPRVRDITIRHLLMHEGGWGTPGLGDLIYERAIQTELGLSRPPTAAEDLRYFLARPLEFTPGSRGSYSNVGYLVLGMIVQQASGTSYVDYVNASVMGPIGVPAADFKMFSSRVRDRGAREPNYINLWRGASVYEPGASVPYDDGVADSANWVSVGTAATTARAMALFAGRFLITRGDDVGTPLAGRTNNGGHAGSLAFSLSVVRQLPSGVSYAVMTNAEAGRHQVLYDAMDGAVAAGVK